MRGKNDQGRELRLDVTALVRQLRLYAGSEYAGTFIDRNPTVTRLLAAMVLEPDNEEQRRPPDDRGLVVSLRDRILRAAPSQERNYLDGWFAVHSSTLGWLSYLLIQARPRSWQPVASGRVTGERGSFSVVLGARPAQQPQGEKSPLGWMREVIQIREVVHPAPSLGSAVDFLEQFLSSEGLGPDNLTAGSGRIYRDGQPFAVILLEPQLAVWEADPAWKPTKRVSPARYGRAGAAERWRCKVLLEIPRSLRIGLRGCFGSWAKVCSSANWSSSSLRGRPPFRPRARAAASPAAVRSRMSARSNSATAPKT